MSDNNLTYSQSGVDYNLLDKLKRMALKAAISTVSKDESAAFSEVEFSRGESAYVVKSGKQYYVFVQEGLGTKNLVADEMSKSSNKSYYDSIAQDAVAMIINDLITSGAKPVVLCAYWALGSINWLKDESRLQDLTSGWGQACKEAGVFWGGGETPVLKGIVNIDTIDLAGSAFGLIESEKNLSYGGRLQSGDAIVVFESSGIHANGLTLARQLADKLPEGYQTRLPSGKMYGEALLTPTIIYAKLVGDLLDIGIQIHYMVNITGHGWRKLMRAAGPFTYRVTSLPPTPEVLQFICEKGPVSDKEAYANFNMGAGFAIFIDKKDIEMVFKSAAKYGIKSYEIGMVEEGEKKVVIEPKNIEFSASSLQLKVF